MHQRPQYLNCSGEYWHKQRMRCLVRDDFRCQALGCDEERLRLLEVHHKRWRIHGGTHDLNNLITLCRAHHVDEHPHLRFELAAPEQVLDRTLPEL